MCNIYIHIPNKKIDRASGFILSVFFFCRFVFFVFFCCFYPVSVLFAVFFLPDSFFLLGFFFAFLLSLFLSHPISCTLPSPDQTLSPPPLLSVSQCVFSIDPSTVCEYRFSTPHFSHDFPFHFVFKYLV